MYRKISSTAAEAHSFSSPFTRPPKPTPLNSRNSTSLFTIPAETTSSCPNNSHYEPKIGVSTARLQKFLQTECKSGNVNADEALHFFHRMVQMEPRFRLYSFNLLLKGLAKNKRYYDVLSLYGQMKSAELTPNFVTLNILFDCSCSTNRIGDAFMVMGTLIRKGYSPNIGTFSSLIEGLCMGGRVADAVRLFLRLEKFGCCPNVITRNILIRGLKLHEEMISGNGEYAAGCESNLFSYSCNIGSLCAEGYEDEAMVLFSEMQERGFSPNAFVYNSLINGFYRARKFEDALSVLDEMGERGIRPVGVALGVILHIICQAGSGEDSRSWLDNGRLDRYIRDSWHGRRCINDLNRCLF